MSPDSSGADTRGEVDRAGERDLRGQLGWALPWLSLVALAVWVGHPGPWWLLLAAAAAAGSGVAGRTSDRARALGIVVLLGATLTGFAAQRLLDRLAHDFDDYWKGREAEVAGTLERELDGLI